MNHPSFDISLHDFSNPINFEPFNFYFLMIIYGDLEIEINEVNYTFRSYDFFNINPETKCIIKNGKGTLGYVFSIEWDSLESYFYLTEDTTFYSNQIPSAHSLELVTNFVNLVESYKRNKKTNDLLIQSDFFKFLYSLSFITALSKTDTTKDYDKYAERRRAIKRFIASKYNDPIKLEDLAHEVFLTPQYLANFIKREFNNTFLQMVLEVRIEKAKKLLLLSKESMTKIALNTGFPNSQSFSRAFKVKNKISPIEYRVVHLSDLTAPKNTTLDEIQLMKADEELITLRNKINTQSITYSYVFDLDIKTSVQQFESKEKTWQEMINLGFGENILSSSFQNHIAQVQNELHFKYGRIQGILNPHLIDNIPNSKKYSYTNFNRVIDYLYSVNLIPHIDFGNKPYKFNIDSSHYQYISHDNYILNLSDWENYISDFILNAVNRYGKEEVTKWHFEMWLPHDHQLTYSSKAIITYADQYAFLYKVIKKTLPDVKIGGFGFNASADKSVIRQVDLELSKRNVGFDFFSFVSFYYEFETVINNGAMTSHHDYLKTAIDEIRRSIYPHRTPIYLTEFSYGVDSRNYIHDSVFHAVFLLYNILNNYRDLKGMGFWRLTDLSEEFKDINTPLFGGNGLVSVDGLKKPVFHAYKLLSYLGNNVVATGNNYIITSKGTGSIQVLVFNYEHPSIVALSQLGHNIIPNQINKIFGDVKQKNYRFILDNTPTGTYRVQTYLLNKDFGSVLDHWIKLGTNVRIDKNEIDYIQDLSKPKQSIEYHTIDTQITLEGKIKTNEIKLIRINQEF